MARKFRCVGINDDFNHCECCGRTDLKRVMMLVSLDADGNPVGEPAPYGTSCGARMLGYTYATPRDRNTFRKAMEAEAVEHAVAHLNAEWVHQLWLKDGWVVNKTQGVNQFKVPILQCEVLAERTELVRFIRPADACTLGYPELARLIAAMRHVHRELIRTVPLEALRLKVVKAFKSQHPSMNREVREVLTYYPPTY